MDASIRPQTRSPGLIGHCQLRRSGFPVKDQLLIRTHDDLVFYHRRSDLNGPFQQCRGDAFVIAVCLDVELCTQYANIHLFAMHDEGCAFHFLHLEIGLAFYGNASLGGEHPRTIRNFATSIEPDMAAIREFNPHSLSDVGSDDERFFDAIDKFNTPDTDINDGQNNGCRNGKALQ